jgi:uncharacterized protein
LQVPRPDRSTTGVSVTEEFNHTKEGRTLAGYRASATLSVRLVDMALIGTIVMRATKELEAEIAGPSWRVSADNAAWLQAASSAAANARAKAAAYAAGLDLTLGPLLGLAEPGDGSRPHRVMAMPASSRSDVPIDVAEQHVTATVQATFALHSS